MKKLPFYDVQATLLKPSSLQPTGQAKFQQQNFSFHLTPQQAEMIQQSGYRDSMGRPDFKKQVLVRFSLLETSCEQEDNFPLSLCVKVCKERNHYYISFTILYFTAFSFLTHEFSHLNSEFRGNDSNQSFPLNSFSISPRNELKLDRFSSLIASERHLLSCCLL